MGHVVRGFQSRPGARPGAAEGVLAQTLDYVGRESDDEDFASLRPRNGVGPNVSFDEHHSTMKGLGAREVHWDKRPPDADYVIMEDPEGNRFCVIDTGL